ncbi:hypothetical protein JCM14713_14470 [Desulfomicrobium salsuginis]
MHRDRADADSDDGAGGDLWDGATGEDGRWRDWHGYLTISTDTKGKGGKSSFGFSQGHK